MKSGDDETQPLSLDIPVGVPMEPGLMRFFPLGRPPAMAFLSIGGGSKQLLGRADLCDIVLNDSNASRKHASIEQSGGGWRIDDLQSSNGVYVNGRPVVTGVLHGGEIIRIGSTLMRFLNVGMNRTDQLYPVDPDEEMILGPGLGELRDTLSRVAASDLAVLLLGETGTGKELVARHLHQKGARSEGRLVTVNCSAIPEHLVESELFGHVKGAFTGADRERKGYIREAHRGTLFLDEIGELPLTSQPKLLRVLQDHEVYPVGSQRGIPVDIRVVAASNRNLESRVVDGSFRQDIYARLAEMVVSLPPLRERITDLPLLVHHFLRKHGRPDAVLTVDAAEFLSCQSWPRNIRQLESAVRRALVLAGEERHLTPELFSDDAQRPEVVLESDVSPFRHVPTSPAHRTSADTLLNQPVPTLVEPSVHPEALTLRESLARHGADVPAVAEELGISVSQVYRRAQKHGIRIAHYRP